MMQPMIPLRLLVVVVQAVLLASVTTSALGFQPLAVVTTTPTRCSSSSSPSALFMSTDTPSKKKGYVPKWTKKKTLADDMGDLDFQDKGIKGTISVVFKQGDVTKTTMAMPGQPLRDVATQAGQFIKYGCGKGECGTCEAMSNGKWIRPCQALVPADATADGGEIVVLVKDIAKKSKSSGQFFSVRSFFMGFYNNLLGMVGFVKYRRNAKQNWDERQEYEDLIRQRTLEKKQKRKLELQKQKKKGSNNNNDEVSP